MNNNKLSCRPPGPSFLVCPLLYRPPRSGIGKMPSYKLVKHVMRPLDQYLFIKEDETVQDAIRLMNQAKGEGRLPCLIVVGEEQGEKDVIKGFLTPREVLFGLTTRFLKGAEKSGPIFWEGQFEAECLEAMTRRVNEVMSPIRAYVRQTEMLMEAVFLLNKYEEDFLPAIGDDEVVGMLHIDDIVMYITTLAQGEPDAQGRLHGGSVSRST